MVCGCWGKAVEEYLMECILRDKLKFLKKMLMVWNREEFGSLESKIKSSSARLMCWELKDELRDLSFIELVAMASDAREIWDLTKCRDS